MATLTLATAAPPTPNGDLHLGHLSGPYSGADILVRARRLQGGDALYLTGSDLHQSYVPTKARRDGVEPLTMAEGFADEIGRIFVKYHELIDGSSSLTIVILYSPPAWGRTVMVSRGTLQPSGPNHCAIWSGSVNAL